MATGGAIAGGGIRRQARSVKRQAIDPILWQTPTVASRRDAPGRDGAVLTRTSPPCQPRCAADGRLLASVLERDDEQLLPDGSPDGRRLVFTSRGGEHEPVFEYNLASGRSRQLFACEGSCLGDDEPAYSPDGRTVAFVRALGPFTDTGPADCSLWLGDVATGRVRRLTDNSSCDR